MGCIELGIFCFENGLIIDVNYNDLNSIKKRNSKANIDLNSLDNDK